jgi:trans-aconitate methyltransferase
LTRADWNRLAPAFERRVFDITAADSDRIISGVLDEIAQSTRIRSCIDFGCGLGTLAGRLARRFRLIYALDYSKHVLARARRMHRLSRNIQWVLTDIRSKDWRLPPADLTTCTNVLTSPSSRLRRELLHAIARATRPRGWTLIVVPSLESAVHVDVVSTGRVPQSTTTGGIVTRAGSRQKHYTKAELRRELRGVGYETVRILPVPYSWTEELLGMNGDLSLKRPWDWLAVSRR